MTTCLDQFFFVFAIAIALNAVSFAQDAGNTHLHDLKNLKGDPIEVKGT